jgi:hypothetical protein
MLALARSVSDLAFNDAFSWGADDVLPFGEIRPLLTRLRNLPREAAEPPKTGRGSALIAEADRTRRTVVARVLRNAGYDVTFAVTSEDAASFSQRPRPEPGRHQRRANAERPSDRRARARVAVATPISFCVVRRAICAPPARACST